MQSPVITRTIDEFRETRPFYNVSLPIYESQISLHVLGLLFLLKSAL